MWGQIPGKVSKHTFLVDDVSTATGINFLNFLFGKTLFFERFLDIFVGADVLQQFSHALDRACAAGREGSSVLELGRAPGAGAQGGQRAALAQRRPRRLRPRPQQDHARRAGHLGGVRRGGYRKPSTSSTAAW